MIHGYEDCNTNTYQSEFDYEYIPKTIVSLYNANITLLISMV